MAEKLESAALPEPSIHRLAFAKFEGQAHQFARFGQPGLELRTEHAEDPFLHTRLTIHAVLWRGRDGDVVGILYHYPQDCHEVNGSLLEKAGNFNVWVRPDSQRQGIATRLLDQAMALWDIDLTAQTYTSAGHAFVTAFVE